MGQNKYLENQVLDCFLIINDMNPKLLTFPLDIAKVIRSSPNFRVLGYEYFCEKYNFTEKEVVNYCQSKSGCTFYNRSENQYIIAVNLSQNKGRVSWTLAHEYAHCFLSHFAKINKPQISENTKEAVADKALEVEADSFAAMLLSPFPLFKPLSISSPRDVQQVFGLSKEASANRYTDYLIWQKTNYKTRLHTDMVKVFNKFIQSYNSNHI